MTTDHTTIKPTTQTESQDTTAQLESQEFWNSCFTTVKYQDLAEEVRNELFDYQRQISVWSKVAHTISGGKLSKPNYTSDVYESVFNDYVQELVEEEVADRLATAVQEATHEFGKAAEKLQAEVLSGRYGTKNRVQLLQKLEALTPKEE